MEEVRPTRAELLERREQIKLAQQGMDLLKQKRDALLIEFMGVMDETLRLSESLQKSVSEAQYSLAVAKAVDGTVALRSAGMATKGEIVVDMTGTKIMGVSVPVVTKGESPIRSSFTRGYSVTGVSSRVDETADKFERILDVIIEYADIETRLKRLGEEIQKTNRRVNALEQVTVPQLTEQVAYIRQTLDERAREDLFRLKKVKKKIERKKAEPAGRMSGQLRAPAGVLAPMDTWGGVAYRGVSDAAPRCFPETACETAGCVASGRERTRHATPEDAACVQVVFGVSQRMDVVV